MKDDLNPKHHREIALAKTRAAIAGAAHRATEAVRWAMAIGLDPDVMAPLIEARDAALKGQALLSPDDFRSEVFDREAI